MEELASILQINISITNSNRKLVKAKINKKMEEVKKYVSKEIDGFDFGWKSKEGDNPRFAYIPYIKWSKVTPEKYKHDLAVILDDVSLKTIKRQLYTMYMDAERDTSEDGFFQWTVKLNHSTITNVIKQVMNSYWVIKDDRLKWCEACAWTIQAIKTKEDFETFFERESKSWKKVIHKFYNPDKE